MTRSKIVPEGTTVVQLWEWQVKDGGEREFLVLEDAYSHEIRHFTYREFDALANKYANVLTARGIGKKSQVTLYLGNCIEFVECASALAKTGVVSVPVDATSASFELDRILGLCQAQTLITCTRNLGEARSNVPDTVKDIIVVIEGGNEDESAFPDLPRLHELTRHEANTLTSDPRVQPQDACEILLTLGTTFASRGATITHTSFVLSGDFVNWKLDINPEDRYMASMVATRVNYQLSTLAPMLTLRATLIILSHYHASCFWHQVCLYRAALVQEIAIIVTTTLHRPVDPGEHDHQVREMCYLLPLNTWDKETFEKRFSVPLLSNYGSIECLIGTITDFPHGGRRWPSIGKVGPGYKIRIADDEDSNLPKSGAGEPVLHGVPGVNLMAGYWDNPEATVEVFGEGGWHYTHDYAYVEDDWVYFVDQRVDLIKYSGESVSSAGVEGVTEDLPGVCEVTAIGVSNGIRGQAAKAFIVAEANTALDAEAVIDHCTGRPTASEVPGFVELVEELPRGSYGEVQERILANS